MQKLSVVTYFWFRPKDIVNKISLLDLLWGQVLDMNFMAQRDIHIYIYMRGILLCGALGPDALRGRKCACLISILRASVCVCDAEEMPQHSKSEPNLNGLSVLAVRVGFHNKAISLPSRCILRWWPNGCETKQTSIESQLWNPPSHRKNKNIQIYKKKNLKVCSGLFICTHKNFSNFKHTNLQA